MSGIKVAIRTTIGRLISADCVVARIARQQLDSQPASYVFGLRRHSPIGERSQSHFNSFQVDLHGKVTRDLQMQFGYTVARAIDSTTSNGSGGDLNNLTIRTLGGNMDSGRQCTTARM